MEDTFFVHEIFYSFQGEGIHAGRAAFFVRLMGCDQRCSFCDSAGTWHPGYKPDNVERRTATEIVAQAKICAHPQAFIVLTGGEPALYRLDPIITTAREAGFKTHIETAGHRPLPRSVDWITLSPKVFATPPLRENIQRANEFKIIVDSYERAAIWLHPEWGHRHDPKILALITETVKGNPRLRAGWQVHKMYKSDVLDEGASKALVPLGGDPSHGASQ
jgi:organic radical activating enzyme